jgi:hypothetical protein
MHEASRERNRRDTANQLEASVRRVYGDAALAQLQFLDRVIFEPAFPCAARPNTPSSAC